MGAPNYQPRELRDVFGAFVTGVTVVTTLDRSGKAHGLTANSFSSVSLAPPLILWSQSLAAPSYPVFRHAERFAINILAEDQVAISSRFARSSDDKFAGVALHDGIAGIPLIDGCAAYIECVNKTSFPGGDHAIFLGGVERVERRPQRPLVFGSGRYLIAHPHDLGGFPLDSALASLAQVHAVRAATPVLAELASELGHTLALSVWGSHGPTVIRWEESGNPVSPLLRTGMVLPMLRSATGLLFGAYLPAALTRPFIDAEGRAEQVPPACESIFDETRRNGFAITRTDALPDLHRGAVQALAVPVFDASGLLVVALTAVQRDDGSNPGWAAQMAPRLKAAADGLSRRLGHHP